MGHYAKKCRGGRRVQEVTTDDTSTFFLDSVKDHTQAWRKILNIQGGSIDFKLDSGADVSIISDKTWTKLKPRVQLNPVSARLISPGGSLKCKGQFIGRTESKGKIYNFRVMATKMGFIKCVNTITDTRVIADTLSRSPLIQEKPDSDLEEAVTAHVAAVEAMLPALTSKLAR